MSRLGLKRLIEYYCPEVQIVDIFDNLRESEKRINIDKPNLIFLDLVFATGEGSGFDLLSKFPNALFQVVIVSGHPEQARNAFKFDVAHFLEKPVNGDDLKEAIKRVKQRLIYQNGSGLIWLN